MVRNFFRFEELGTNYRREIVAGLTTFVTMAYIVVVNPNILHTAVDPDIVERATGSTDPTGIIPTLMVTTIIAAIVGTLLMGLYAKRAPSPSPPTWVRTPLSLLRLWPRWGSAGGRG